MPTLLLASAPTRTFSRAVMDLNSRMFWKVRAIPSWVILKRFILDRGRPSKRISPLVAW